MAEFKPTWLYIKKHNITGLKYFGKTTKPDPNLYKGSGVRWTRHLKKHGNDVSTIWTKLFYDVTELTDFAKSFSVDNKIVESLDWANLKIEDGLMGGHHNNFTPAGIEKLKEKSKNLRHTEETKEKLRVYRKNQTDPRLGKTHTEDSKNKIKEARKLQIVSDETKNKISEALKIKWATRKALEGVNRGEA